jgi:hypothetical protein
MTKYILILFSILLFSCGSPADALEELDLMKEGVPLKIKAPEDAIVKQKDMGIFKDITVRKGDDFYIQITGAQKFNDDLSARKAEELSTVKGFDTFSKIIQEDERGFIFEKKKGDSMVYDFRSVKFVGDNEYLFQSGLIGSFALEQVEVMYDAVK